MDKELESKDLMAGLSKFGAEKKKGHLEEVKADARYNYLKRLKEQREREAAEALREQGIDPADVLMKELTEKDSSKPKKG